MVFKNNRTVKTGRPIFFTPNNQAIRAGGVIFRRKNIFTGKEEWLMQLSYEKANQTKGAKKYSDLGGKIDRGDQCIEHTISRECCEESNKVISSINWRKAKYVYIPDSRYLLVFVEANHRISRLKSSNFGMYEVGYDDWKRFRKIEWVDPYTACKQFHVRLRYIKTNIKQIRCR